MTLNPIDDVPGIEDATLIGQGGFGDVYRAHQPQLDRLVAIKILHSRPDDHTVRVFRRESQALGRVSSHPNIVTLYQADVTAGGHPFMVMEYASNGSLEDQIRTSGTLAWEQLVEVGRALCSALGAAHLVGIRHRDLKPANIFWSDHGVPLLGDFGIATLAGRTQTDSGAITATIAHASPEQLDGRAVDHRTDIYSLGSTLYHLAAGHPPHAADRDADILSIMSGVLMREPEPIRAIPAHVNFAILAAMAKNPDERPTIDEMRDLLTTPVGTSATLTLPPPEGGSDARREPEPQPVNNGPATFDPPDASAGRPSGRAGSVDLVVALQAAIARADPSWISQPSHLRRRLEEELGSRARSHRAQIHQLTVAAEERVPIRLRRNGWSPAERDELVKLLVGTRGWTSTASEWTVVTWAAALGLTDERPSTPPTGSRQETVTVPGTPPDPPGGSADRGPGGPKESPSESADHTAKPPPKGPLSRFRRKPTNTAARDRS